MSVETATQVLAEITIGIDPTIELGPLSFTWHGLMIAVGITLGGVMATRYARERGLDPDRVLTLVLIMAVAGILGARLFYLAVNDADSLLRPGDWLGSRGFAFYGAVILGTVAVALYLRGTRSSPRYLDALAAGFPLGLAVGRIGDVINGEHYGPPTDAPWGLRHTSAAADVPSTMIAYHDGGLYELVLGLAIFAIVWPLRNRFRRPLTLLWSTIALYGVGRFAMFFYRSDSESLALGLNEAQWTSVALVAVAAVGLLVARRQPDRPATGPASTATTGA